MASHLRTTGCKRL